MATIEHCTLYSENTDMEWRWEQPIYVPSEPRERTPTHVVRHTRDGRFLLVPNQRGPIVRTPKPGSKQPELVQLPRNSTPPTGRKAVPQCKEKTIRLQTLAHELLGNNMKVVHREGTPELDPDEALHPVSDYILTGMTVSSEYQTMKIGARTDRFYGV